MFFPVAQNLQSIIQDQIRTLSSGPTVMVSADDEKEARLQRNASAGLTAETANATVSNNAQAALMILLTAQMQSQTGEASLLQDDQVVGILQDLVNQASDPNAVTGGSLNDILTTNPALGQVFDPSRLQWMPMVTPPVAASQPMPAHAHSSAKARPTLLADPPARQSPAGADLTGASPTPPVVANNLNNLLNTQNLNQLLGSLTNAGPGVPTSAAAASSSTMSAPSSTAPVYSRAPGVRPVLLGDSPAHAQPPTGLPQAHYPSAVQLPLANLPQSVMPPSPFLAAGQAGQPHSPFLFAGMPVQMTMPPPMSFYAQPAPLAPQHASLMANLAMRPYADAQLAYHYLPQGHYPHIAGYQSALEQAHAQVQAQAQAQAQAHVQAHARLQDAFLSPLPSNAYKRKLTIPPSPEQSPEGPYIGQHSQGIGGHYADSYWNKRSKFS
jgi:hypothetical protein